MNVSPRSLALAAIPALAIAGSAQAANDVYIGFPVTVKGYAGDAETSVSYSGQIARQVLHDSLKRLAGQGDGTSNPDLEARMKAYYSGKGPGREILAPRSNGAFVIEQKTVEEISEDRDLASKTYGGAITAWPGNRTGSEVIEFWIEKAASAHGGFDPLTGYDYPQLISKFAMGAVFYNQAVAHYLGENMARDRKPNDQPYSDGAAYTGKEHVWDEAFGYFGAPVHAVHLTPQQVYSIAKLDESVLAAADYDGNGEIDLETEMTFGPAYYAADADKSGRTEYLKTITRAFIDGRSVITSAAGGKLTDAQYAKLHGYVDVIRTNWGKVLAEATFKYAGSVYSDLQALQEIIESNADPSDAFASYGKHWGELKGFSMALQTSGRDLGATAVELNRLIGYSPVLLGGNQVTGVDGNGDYVIGESVSMGEYMKNMLKVQALMVDAFGVTARKNDAMSGMAELTRKIGEKKAAETD